MAKLPNYLKTRKALLQIRLLENKNCRNIIELIRKEKEVDVTTIHTKLNLVQPTASQFLANMREYNFVESRKVGKRVFYSVNEEQMQKISTLVNNF